MGRNGIQILSLQWRPRFRKLRHAYRNFPPGTWRLRPRVLWRRFPPQWTLFLGPSYLPSPLWLPVALRCRTSWLKFIWWRGKGVFRFWAKLSVRFWHFGSCFYNFQSYRCLTSFLCMSIVLTKKEKLSRTWALIPLCKASTISSDDEELTSVTEDCKNE